MTAPAPAKRTLRTCAPCVGCKLLATAGQPCPRCGLSVPALAAGKTAKKAPSAKKARKPNTQPHRGLGDLD